MMRKDRMENPVTEAAASSALHNYELPTNDIPIDFDGWFIDSLDNGGKDRIRWAVLELYRWQPKDGGPLGYILYTIGHSLVYHDQESECGKGVRTTVGSLAAVTDEDARDLEPCPDCSPPLLEDLGADDEIEMEETWYKWSQARNADELLLALRKEARCRNCFHRPHDGHLCGTCRSCTDYSEAPRPLSIPGQRLLAQVKSREPEIARALKEKKTRL